MTPRIEERVGQFLTQGTRALRRRRRRNRRRPRSPSRRPTRRSLQPGEPRGAQAQSLSRRGSSAATVTRVGHARPRGGQGPLRHRRGRDREPRRAAEDRHARQGEGLDGPRPADHGASSASPSARSGTRSGLSSRERRRSAPESSSPRRAPKRPRKALAARHGPPDERPALRKNLGILRQVQMGEVQLDRQEPGDDEVLPVQERQVADHPALRRHADSSGDPWRRSTGASGGQPVSSPARPRVRGDPPRHGPDRAVRRRAEPEHARQVPDAPRARRPRRRPRASTSSSSCSTSSIRTAF